MSTAAYAAKQAKQPLEPMTIERRQPGPDDVAIDILYCGVCHSDIHMVHNDWGFAQFPLVPGHEIVGRVRTVGERVAHFKEGDLVGVGCLVGSCGQCDNCHEHLEQYCPGMVMTYGSKDAISGGFTYGGYSKAIVVHQDFVLRINESLDTKAVPPLLCAGITTFSPLRKWKVGAGDKVGVIGLGGLGHMGVKFAAAMGAHVVMITTSAEKGDDAKKLGAHEVLISTDAQQMQAHANSFDFLLNTIPVPHDINPYVELLKRDRTMVLVGVIGKLQEVNAASLVFQRKSIAGSLIGGLAETQDMLDFCAEHNIVSEVEMINIQDINSAYQRVQTGDVKYRFVIDMDSL